MNCRDDGESRPEHTFRLGSLIHIVKGDHQPQGSSAQAKNRKRIDGRHRPTQQPSPLRLYLYRDGSVDGACSSCDRRAQHDCIHNRQDARDDPGQDRQNAGRTFHRLVPISATSLVRLQSGQFEFICQVARHPVVSTNVPENGWVLRAHRLRVLAAGMEIASRRRIRRIGNFTH